MAVYIVRWLAALFPLLIMITPATRADPEGTMLKAASKPKSFFTASPPLNARPEAVVATALRCARSYSPLHNPLLGPNAGIAYGRPRPTAHPTPALW